MEAIATLKEPGGSNKTTIAAYIEVFSFISYFLLFLAETDRSIAVVMWVSLFGLEYQKSRFCIYFRNMPRTLIFLYLII